MLKNIFLLLIFVFSSFEVYAASGTPVTSQIDGVVVSPDAVIPNIDGVRNYKGKLSDQIWHDIRSKGVNSLGERRTTGAVCDGTSRPLSSFYASLAAAQADWPNATSLTQETDGVAIEWYMSNNKNFYIPEGTCLINFESSLSNKTFRVVGHPNSLIKGSGASELTELFSCSACEIYAYRFRVDGENKFTVPLYINNPLTTVVLDPDIRDIGWPTTIAENLVAPIWANGNMTKPLIFEGGYVEDVRSVGDGTTGNNIGGARMFPNFTPASGAKPQIIIKDWTADANGSDAEELDMFNQNVNVVYGSWLTLQNPTFYYNGKVRRLIKIHSGDTVVYNGKSFKSADFVTAPTAIGSTNVGAENLNGIDYAGSGQGSITLYGGQYDLSGFAAGFASTSGCTDCYIRAFGTEFIGPIFQVDRHDPETAVSGTAAGGTATTVILEAARSSSVSSFYNNATIIMGGGGSCPVDGESKTISSYVGSTRTATVTAWAGGSPTTACTYSIQKPVVASTSLFVTGSSDVGSGCDGCYFKDGYNAVQLRGHQSYVRNTTIDDSVSYPIWLNPTVTRQNTAQAGASTTITLDAGASGVDDIYNNTQIIILTGACAEQQKTITDYVGSTKVATVDSAWASCTPDTTSVFQVGPRLGQSVENNTIITKTPGRMKNDTSGNSLFRIIPVQNAHQYIIRNNRFIQHGNTDHQCTFIDELTANVGGIVAFNTIPPNARCTGAALMDDHRKNAASTSTVVGNNFQIETVLNVNTTTVGNVGTGEDALQTFSVQSNSLSKAGQGIAIRAAGDFANNANAKTLTYDIGGTNIFSQALPTALAGAWKADILLFRTGSNTQMYEFEMEYTSSAGVTTSVIGNGTLSLTDTSAITVRGEGSATSNNDITQDLHFIKQVN